MSPEQARGKPVDKRADIWAFGVVLWEMLTGKRLFVGDTVSDVLAAVLTHAPDWTAVPAAIPPTVRSILARCLERDVRQRLRDIGEARVALGDTSSLGATSAAPQASPGATHWRAPAVWGVLAFVALTLVVAAWAHLRASTPPAVTRLSIPLSPGQVLAGVGSPAVSRDGRQIAYVAREAGGESRLYLRALDRFASEVVQGSEDAQQPFFSPDGARVAFFARGKLLTASVSGGAPTAIADASYFTFGGSWGDDDTIVFVPTLGSGLLRVPSAGGQPQKVTEPDEASGGYAHVWPQVLPGGRSVLFTIWGGLNGAADGSAVLSLETGTRSPVLPSIWSARYARSGHVLVSGARGVMAAPFDLRHPRATRAQAFVVDEVAYSQAATNSWFSVSDTGTLVYAPASPTWARSPGSTGAGSSHPPAGRPSSSRIRRCPPTVRGSSSKKEASSGPWTCAAEQRPA